jgi:anti-sigma factor RsiW
MGALKAGCDRAREWISLALDGELSELEHAQLQRHLRRCVSCAAYAATVSAATGELRAAPEVAVSVDVPLRRIRRGSARRMIAPIAAALAIVAGTLGTTSVAQAPSSQTSKPPFFEKRLMTLARHASHRAIDISS